MPMIMSSRIAHSQPSQGDLDLLALLTSDSTSMGPLSTGAPHAHTHPHQKRQLPRRENPVDALLISAVLAGSGNVTRHHLGHAVRKLTSPRSHDLGGANQLARPGAYASCDDSHPPSPTRDPIPSKVVMPSQQAPRSERLRVETENEAHARPSVEKLGQSSSDPSPVLRERSSSGAKARRRMSIDPAPVSQMLQAASPSTNFFASTPYSQPNTQIPKRGPSSRPLVRCMARTRIPTPHGELFLHLYNNSADNKEHLAVVIDPIQLSEDQREAAPNGRREIRSRSLNEKWREGETDMERVVRGAYVGRLSPGGEGQASTPITERPGRIAEEVEEEDILPLVRIHSECFTGETIGSMRCDCGEQLDEALRLIARPQLPPTLHQSSSATDSQSPSPLSQSINAVPGRGVVIYMRQEGRGIGLLEKIRAYNLQDLGHDTVTANLMLGHGADERKYDVAAEILRDLGLAGEGGEAIRLLTNNPDKVGGLTKEGVRVKERVGMVPRDWKCRDGHRSDGAGQEQEYADWRERRAGVGLIGAGKASGVELEKYLRTKVERMGHSEFTAFSN